MQRVAVGLALFACTACSFRPTPGTGNGNTPVDGAPPGDTAAHRDAPGDAQLAAPADAMPTGCMSRWYSGTPPTFTAATLDISVVGRIDRDPMLVSGETTLYFSSDRPPDEAGDLDVWEVSRAAKTDAFQAAGVEIGSDVAALDDGYVEGKIALSAAQPDDMLYVGDKAAGVDHLWHSHRTAGAFAAGDQIGLAAVNGTGTSQGDPSLSADGLRLYFSAVLADGIQHVMLATRASLTDAFGSGAKIAELDSGTGDADPALTPGEQVIVFSSLRGGAGTAHIYYAVRDDGSGAFGSAQPLATVNSAEDDADPVISEDGCRIYFATDRSNENELGDYDLWMASMVLPAE
jgi:hypothetical protein